MFQPGQSFGKFYLVQLIGEGGTSRIFKALQQPINRVVALKIPSFPETGAILTPDEFLIEATLMARLDHGNVVRIYDFGVYEDSAFICMEYVEGSNLQEWTEARGPLSLSATLAAGWQTLDGLRHSHSRGVLHLDLSPANVLIAKSGTVKLSDFGMAGKKRAAGGEIVGTPAFLSPEHVAGAAGTSQSDLFSYASLLYHAATGGSLFDPGENRGRIGEVLREIAAARAHPPLDRLSRLPASLARIVAMALQGSDADSLSKEIKAAWRNIEGEESPEAVLRRELEGDAPSADFPEADGILSDKDLRIRYLDLRRDGRHREAMALLEKALKRQPDNPILRELLATPPAKAKSAPVTMAVGTDSLPNEAEEHAPPRAASVPDGRRPGLRNLATAIVGLLALTLGLFAWHEVRNQDAAPGPEPAPEVKGPDPEFPNRPDAGLSAPPPDAPATPRSRAAGAAAALKKPKRPAPRSPALALKGPAGTRITVDDSVEWVSPGPAGGWTLAPGLVNITLTPPGKRPAISSSLFLSEDTLYVLSLEDDGGFSVTRQRR